MKHFLVLIATVFSLQAVASPLGFFSFEKDWRRYPPPDVILALLKQKFPHVDPKALPVGCTQVTVINRPALGDDVPAAGTPMTPQPSAAFVDWMHACVVAFVNIEQGAVAKLEPAVLREFWGADIYDACLAQNPDRPLNLLIFECQWTKLDPVLRTKVLGHEIFRILGPEEVLIEFEIAESEAQLNALVAEELMDVAVSNSDRYKFLGVTPECPEPGKCQLTAQRALSLSHYLLLLTDWLRY